MPRPEPSEYGAFYARYVALVDGESLLDALRRLGIAARDVGITDGGCLATVRSCGPRAEPAAIE